MQRQRYSSNNCLRSLLITSKKKKEMTGRVVRPMEKQKQKERQKEKQKHKEPTFAAELYATPHFASNAPSNRAAPPLNRKRALKAVPPNLHWRTRQPTR
jgi:hypothetical protein